MARKAIQSVVSDTQKSVNNKGKREIKVLPMVFANEEHFRAYIALATLLSSDKAADAANEKLTVNKLLTVNQSIAHYKANGIDLEKEFYPVAVNIGGLSCGINRKQHVIFAVGFIGSSKLAFIISTRANKELPELVSNKDVKEKFGYAPKFLTRLDSNNGTLLPAAIDFNHIAVNNFGLPYCYTTSRADLLDYAQWLNNPNAFDDYKAAAAEFESVDYYDANCIAEFVKTAENNGFEVFRQDYMKVAIDYQKYLQSVIDGDNFTATQKDKARAILSSASGAKVKAEKQAEKSV